MSALKHPLKRIVDAPATLIGGWQRLQVIIVLAAVLGVDGADKATVGAIGVELEQALGIGSAKLGLLVTASTLIGAIATLPIGVLVDRVNRKRILLIGIVVWSLAMLASGFATSYLFLLITRLALGALIAAAAPAIASLIGDYFPSHERGRIWGYVLAGELLGTAFGFVVSGTLAGLISWRAAFIALAIAGFVLTFFVARVITEPMRGGHARLPPYGSSSRMAASDREAAESQLAEDIEAYDIQPDFDRVIEDDPARWSLWRAARHILTMRTNLLLIAASALGYFYFTGLRAFATVYMSKAFALSPSMATMINVSTGLGAIVGVLLAGRFADHLVGRGIINGRIFVAGGAFLLTAALFLPGLLVPSLVISLVLFFLAALFLGATNPPLDAARLDIMHSRLWGRAESIRTTFRYLFEAAAPITFGVTASLFDSPNTSSGHASNASAHSASGLQFALLIMLGVMVLGGVVLLLAYRSYPRDAATALASEHASANDDGPDHATE